MLPEAPWRLERQQDGPKLYLAVIAASGHILNAIEAHECEDGSNHPQRVPMAAEDVTAAFRLMAAAPALLRLLRGMTYLRADEPKSSARQKCYAESRELLAELKDL